MGKLLVVLMLWVAAVIFLAAAFTAPAHAAASHEEYLQGAVSIAGSVILFWAVLLCPRLIVRFLLVALMRLVLLVLLCIAMLGRWVMTLDHWLAMAYRLALPKEEVANGR